MRIAAKSYPGKPPVSGKQGGKKPSGKQTDSPAQQESGTQPGKADFGVKVCRNEKSGYLCNPEPGRFPRSECPGLTHNSLAGLHKANHGVKVGNDGV